MAYQSLYRRYRPQRFREVRGQEHLVTALRNAVVEDRVGHAYLFSGPRGTGKTSTARILAKVLNCENPQDGEPCCACPSCLAIEAGTSFDVHELDAASNNKVEDVRELISKASHGTPGNTKVYILDEVHMLSTAASNALLKTLEEPPEHVVFVLATTDPQKVLPTIRSRTQHFEVHLLPAADLEALVDDVVADAGLDLSPEGRAYVLRAGAGSARDTLSALDRVVAAGGVPDSVDAVDDLVEALCEHDTGRALTAVEDALSRGRNPRVLGESLIARLRDVFLASVGAELTRLPEADRERVADQAHRLTPAGTTRALEQLGDAFVGIQDALDPRIPLEVALVRLTRIDADTSAAALAERISRLERGIAAAPAGSGRGIDAPPAAPTAPAPARPSEGAAEPAGSPARPGPTPTDASAPPGDATPPDDAGPDADAPAQPSGAGRPADGAREVLRRRAGGREGGGSTRPPARSAPARPPSPPRPSRPAGDERREPTRSAPADEPSAGAPEPPPSASASPGSATDDTPAPPAPSASTGSGGGLPSRDEITLAWGDALLGALPQRAKARFGGGHWVRVDDDAAVFGLPNPVHAQRCEDVKGDVEATLAQHFGRPVPVRLVVDEGVPDPGAPHLSVAPPPASDAREVREDEGIDPDELTDAPDGATSGLDRIAAVFPGAELVTDDDA